MDTDGSKQKPTKKQGEMCVKTLRTCTMLDIVNVPVHLLSLLHNCTSCFIVNVAKKRPREKSGSAEAGGAVKKPPKKKQKPEGLYSYTPSFSCTLILCF